MNDTEKKFAITALQDEVFRIRNKIYGLFGGKTSEIWDDLVRLEILASARAKIEMLNFEQKGEEE